MTALVALAQAEHVPCLQCDGTGVRPAGQVEAETGVHSTVVCWVCHGDCVVEAEAVSRCDVCAVAFWTGDGCGHGVDILCSECVERCMDCVDEAQTEIAETARRELHVLNGGL